MAAKSRKTCLKDLMVVLRLLASTEQKKCPVSSETKRNNTFDELLEQNLSLTRQALANDATLQGLEQVVDIARYLATECVCKLSDSSGESEPSMSNSSEGDGLSEQGHGASPDSKTKVGTAVNGQSGGVAVRWTFCHVCLRILSGVREALQGGKDSEKDEKASKMDLLSISDQKVVSMVIQLVVVLGICPNLLPAVGIPIEQRSGFSHILKGDSEETSPRCPMCLYKFTMALVQCLGEPTLSMLILSRHLSDVLLSLMQLAHAPEICLDKNDGGKMSSKNHNAEGIEGEAKLSTCESSQTSTKLENHGVCHRCHKSVGCVGGVLISGAEREECAKALKNIVDKMYQPLIVRELLFLQGNMAGKKPVMNKSSKSLDGLQKKSTDGPMEGRAASRTPQWLKDVCGHLLSKCLMKKHGVQSVLRGILEGASGTAIEWKVCEAIAQLIANCPLQVQSPEDYYKSICPQVLTLLDLQNPKQRHQYGRVAVQIIHAMITRYPDLATKFLQEMRSIS